MAVAGCGDEGKNACHASNQEIRDYAKFEHDVHKRKCAAGNSSYCSGWANGIPRLITGTHTGFSVTADFFYGKYYYEQTDVLYDWKTGTKYTTKTVTPVEGNYIGTPNGVSIEFYGGNTFVFGIPLSATPDEVKGLLDGPNSDYAFDAGGELLPEIGANSGVGFSRDLDPKNGMPVTTSAVEMFAIETKVGGSVSVLPSPWIIEGGAEWGRSMTTVVSVVPISWWPFK